MLMRKGSWPPVRYFSFLTNKLYMFTRKASAPCVVFNVFVRILFCFFAQNNTRFVSEFVFLLQTLDGVMFGSG